MPVSLSPLSQSNFLLCILSLLLLLLSLFLLQHSDEFIDVENAPTDLGQSSAKAISHACHAHLYMLKGEIEKKKKVRMR